MPAPAAEFTVDLWVDALIIGSGGGGMSAALTAKHAGLDTLIVEKAPYFGGSTALSGGATWIPGANAQIRTGHRPDPDEVFRYLRTITEGAVSDARLRAYVEMSPKMLDLIERLTSIQFVWKAEYSDYYPEAPGGSARGSTISLEPFDLRRLGSDESKLLRPRIASPRGWWIRPAEQLDSLNVRQSWRGKLLLARYAWRMLRARLLGERVAPGGQALAAQLWLGLRNLGVKVWLESPLLSLITSANGGVGGAVIRHEGRDVRVGARGGVVLATGGFDHNLLLRKEHQPFLSNTDWSFGSLGNTGDGIRAGQDVGAAVDLMDEAWWYPTIAWPDGRLSMPLVERMIPPQFIVNGAGKRFIHEGTPYMEFGQHLIRGQQTNVTHIPCWLITDSRSWRRYPFLGHLPIPRIPFAPVPTGRKVPRAWLDSGVVKQADNWPDLARAIGVPADALDETARRYNTMAEAGHDDDFQRGDSAYERHFGDATAPNPNFGPVDSPPYIAVRLVLGDLGTNGGLVTDEHARVLRTDGSVIEGFYAVGNTSAAVMGRTYAGAGATIGSAMTFGYVAALHLAGRLGDDQFR